jgi:hypothetical protein
MWCHGRVCKSRAGLWRILQCMAVIGQRQSFSGMVVSMVQGSSVSSVYVLIKLVVYYYYYIMFSVFSFCLITFLDCKYFRILISSSLYVSFYIFSMKTYVYSSVK